MGPGREDCCTAANCGMRASLPQPHASRQVQDAGPAGEGAVMKSCTNAAWSAAYAPSLCEVLHPCWNVFHHNVGIMENNE